MPSISIVDDLCLLYSAEVGYTFEGGGKQAADWRFLWFECWLLFVLFAVCACLKGWGLGLQSEEVNDRIYTTTVIEDCRTPSGREFELSSLTLSWFLAPLVVVTARWPSFDAGWSTVQ